MRSALSMLIGLTLAAVATAQQETPAAQSPGASAQAATSSSSEPTGVIEGVITTTDGPATGDVVVYLEPTDPVVKFDVRAEAAVISQKGATFKPSLLVVCVGQEVEFRNDEDRAIEHNVFSRSPTKEFDLGVYKPGVDKRVKFDQPGPVKLFCSIHRYMDGCIYVAPTPFFAYMAEGGAYRIEGVPCGEYHVRTWQRRQRYNEAEATVKVEADAPEQRVDLSLAR